MNAAKPRAARTASGDWSYRGFIVSQCYRTKRWVAFKDDSLHGTEVFWAQTLRAAKFRIDCFFDDCHDAHTCRHGVDK